MGDFELVFFRCEYLVDLLKRAHSCAGECIEIAHIDEEITCALIVCQTRGFEQLCLALSIEPAANVKDRYRHTGLHLLRYDLKVTVHNLILTSKRFHWNEFCRSQASFTEPASTKPRLPFVAFTFSHF